MIWCRVSEMIRLAITGLARDAVGLPGQTVTSGDMVKVTSITSHGLSRVTCHESRVSRARPWRATSGRRTSPGCGGGWWPRWACWWRPSCSTPRSPSSSPPRWTVTTSQLVTCHVSRVTCHVLCVTCHAPGLNTGQLGLATPASTATTLVTATLLGYGGARAGALGLNELRCGREEES